MNITLGIIREEKIPADKRVPFTPSQAREIMEKFPHVKVVCQASSVRCYEDSEYASQGVEITQTVADCDILMGVKEVPTPSLIPEKTYLFFSHTMKQQPYNKSLLQTILKEKITLIDYEIIRNEQGERLVAFGRYAGIVGAYNGLWTYGKRYKRFTLRRAYECYDLDDLVTEIKKVDLPPLKIVITGSGRVGHGACEIMKEAGIARVTPEAFISQAYKYPTYTQLTSEDYHVHTGGLPFDRAGFHADPSAYNSDFLKYARAADMLIAGAYWNPTAPKLFTAKDMLDPAFRIRIIADISCDINGSIPSTIKATNVRAPLYDYDPTQQIAVEPLSGENHVTVMAIDNLPCELPRSASEDFGRDLIDQVLPSLLQNDSLHIIQRATIAKQGQLTENYQYLAQYAGVSIS